MWTMIADSTSFFLQPSTGTAADGALEAIEEPLQVLGRVRAVHLARQSIHALVGGAQRARRALALEVIAVGLLGPPLRARADERRQFLFAVMLALRHRGSACKKYPYSR